MASHRARSRISDRLQPNRIHAPLHPTQQLHSRNSRSMSPRRPLKLVSHRFVFSLAHINILIIPNIPRHDKRPLRLTTRRRNMSRGAQRRDMLFAERLVRRDERSLRERMSACVRDVQRHAGACGAGEMWSCVWGREVYGEWMGMLFEGGMVWEYE